MDRTLLLKRLSEAEEAYHNLMIGGAARVFVDQNGERIEYNIQSSRTLAAYIDSLKAMLGMGCTSPMRVFI